MRDTVSFTIENPFCSITLENITSRMILQKNRTGNIIQIKAETIPRSKIYWDKYIDKIKSGTKINSKTANITESCTRLAFDNRFSSALQLLRVKIFLDSFCISSPPFCNNYSTFPPENQLQIGNLRGDFGCVKRDIIYFDLPSSCSAKKSAFCEFVRIDFAEAYKHFREYSLFRRAIPSNIPFRSTLFVNLQFGYKILCALSILSFVNICTDRSSLAQKLICQNRLFHICFYITAKKNDLLCKLFGFISQNTFCHYHHLKNIIA